MEEFSGTGGHLEFGIHAFIAFTLSLTVVLWTPLYTVTHHTFNARMRIFPNSIGTHKHFFFHPESVRKNSETYTYNMRHRPLDQSGLESGDSAAQRRHPDAGAALQEPGQERAAHLERGSGYLAGFLARRVRGAVGGDPEAGHRERHQCV